VRMQVVPSRFLHLMKHDKSVNSLLEPVRSREAGCGLLPTVRLLGTRLRTDEIKQISSLNQAIFLLELIDLKQAVISILPNKENL
jgi:hypothetical protein